MFGNGPPERHRSRAPVMMEQGSGLVINVASHAAGGSGKSAGSRVILPYSTRELGVMTE